MSILNTTPVSPAVAASNQIQQIAQQLFALLAQGGSRAYSLIFKNPKATPQEVVAALGTNAAEAFALQQVLIDAIQSAATAAGATPPVIPSVPPGWSLTVNDDGTVTLNAPASSSSNSS